MCTCLQEKKQGGKCVCLFIHEEIGRLCVWLSHDRKGGGCNFKRALGQGNISRNTTNTTKRNKIKKRAVNALLTLRGARLG